MLRESSRAPIDGSCSSTLSLALASFGGCGCGAAPSEVGPGRQLAPPEEGVAACSVLRLARGPLLMPEASRCGVPRLASSRPTCSSWLQTDERWKPYSACTAAAQVRRRARSTGGTHAASSSSEAGDSHGRHAGLPGLGSAR